MDRGISRIRTTTAATAADRVAPMKDREREEHSDFAEELEHRDNQPELAGPPAPTPNDQRREESPSLGYPTEDESGGSLDLTA